MKNDYLKVLRPIVGLSGIVGLLVYFIASAPKQSEFELVKERQYDLTWCDESKREYAGKLEIGYRGASQDIYVDKKPFGSLDEVRIRYFSDSHRTNEILKAVNERDRGRFDILEHFTKKRHPAYLTD